MITGGIISRMLRTATRPLIFCGRYGNIWDCFHSLHGSRHKVVASKMTLQNFIMYSNTFHRFGISSSTFPHSKANETSQNERETSNIPNDTKESTIADLNERKELDSNEEHLTMKEMEKHVAEKNELMKTNQEQIEQMKDKLHQAYTEMKSVMKRTKRETENSKKFEIQSLLDAADNLRSASSVVKESFANKAEVVPVLKTLLERVEMTENQLAEVFKKLGVKKYDPMNEQFDPNRHKAVFQVPDSTRPPDCVVVVHRVGYIRNDQVLRPAEVGVSVTMDKKVANKEFQSKNTPEQTTSLGDTLMDTYIYEKYLDSRERVIEQESLKHEHDEPKEEKLDAKCSILTSPNEEEINNLGSDSHTLGEDSSSHTIIENSGSSISNEDWGFNLDDIFSFFDDD